MGLPPTHADSKTPLARLPLEQFRDAGSGQTLTPDGTHGHACLPCHHACPCIRMTIGGAPCRDPIISKKESPPTWAPQPCALCTATVPALARPCMRASRLRDQAPQRRPRPTTGDLLHPQQRRVICRHAQRAQPIGRLRFGETPCTRARCSGTGRSHVLAC